jgi:hypothetical protein
MATQPSIDDLDEFSQIGSATEFVRLPPLIMTTMVPHCCLLCILGCECSSMHCDHITA